MLDHRRIREKYEAELREVERSERSTLEKFNSMKVSVFTDRSTHVLYGSLLLSHHLGEHEGKCCHVGVQGNSGDLVASYPGSSPAEKWEGVSPLEAFATMQ